MFGEGKRAAGKFVRAYAVPGEGRLGFATAKAIGGKPCRNRSKRRVREAARLSPDRIAAKLDIVLFAKKESAKAPWHELAEDVRNVLGLVAQRWDGELESRL
ncbi:MAG: ribonuclease P protein component [Fimbriimonadaceae bacterium]|nr:ribonuclease P protein component [Fimbriimonadaceae bacterium]